MLQRQNDMIHQSSVTLLVVDDDPDLREVIALDLEQKGFQVLCADNGKNALQIIKTNHVDVVLSDVRMPDGNGVQLLQWIRELNWKAPGLIFMTGFSDISPEGAYDLGADAIFSKPFDRDALHEAILRCLMPREKLWSIRPGSFEHEITVNLEFPDLNIGRGGMFAALSDPLPRVGSKVNFTLNFLDEGPGCYATGEGVVRWVRNQDIAFESRILPAGCGIEFLYLNDSCRKKIVDLVDRLQSKAFIPSA